MNGATIETLKTISDEIYNANSENINNLLIECVKEPLYYDYFNIDNYIENDYFMIVSSTLKTSQGTAVINLDNGEQILSWSFNNDKLKTGNYAILEFDIEITTDKIGTRGYFPVSKNIKISSKVPNESTYEQNLNTTLVLKSGYEVKYDANPPTGCNISSKNTEYYYPFENLTLPSENPTCDGYQFRGWEIQEEVQYVNDETIIMPANDINIVGTWSKLSISKSMTGKVYEKTNLYKTLANKAVLDNTTSAYVTNKSGIDFTEPSSDTNGKGVYTIASTKNDTYPIHYFRGDVDYNHVLFAGFCWKIVRTTDTGGVKLIYNGTPENGTCSYIKNNNIITTGSSVDSPTILANIGYMRGETYNTSSTSVSRKWYQWIENTYLNNKSSVGATNYYYSKNVTYSDGTYTLVNPTQYLWSENYSNLQGYYTCLSETETTCTSLAYLEIVASTSMKYVKLNSGNTKESIDAYIDNLYWVFGNDYIKNEDNTYTLVDTVNVKMGDYANEMEKIANGHHYTCLSASTTCTNYVQYVYSVQSSHIYHVQISNQKVSDNILLEMTEQSSNTTDSGFKKAIDTWYQNYLSDYTSYLEDTIWCNDRSIIDKSGWNKDTNNLNFSLRFSANARINDGTPSLVCKLANDRFTVNSNNGNGRLTYPIGMLTADEFLYSGSDVTDSSITYLKAVEYPIREPYKVDFHAMTPSVFSGGMISNYALNANSKNTIVGANQAAPYSIRPSISLKSGTEYISGDGTGTNPYVIATEADYFYDRIIAGAVADNVASTYVKNSTGIDFTQPSSDTNGKGLYMLSSTANDKRPIYYFRGNVTNNNLIFGGFCWKVVRTTDKGGIKLLYNGVPTDNQCTATGTDTTTGTTYASAYASYSNSHNFGYMYNGNNSNSTMKTTLEKWFNATLINYKSSLEDSVWCDDHVIYSSDSTTMSFTTNVFNRISNGTPSLACSSSDCSYTVSTSNGNGKILAPVGLLTADEAMFAGLTTGSTATTYLDPQGVLTSYHFLSHSAYGGGSHYVYIYTSGKLTTQAAAAKLYTRPSITLNNYVRYVSGSGTTTDPYIVK